MQRRAGKQSVDEPLPDARRPLISASEIQTVSVVGAGVMGRGIAAVNLQAGRAVRLCDADPQVADRAVKELQLSCVAGRDFLPSSGRPQVSVAVSDADLGDADLVIEAVPEDLATKSAVLQRIQECARRDTLIASNSSSIPMAQLAEACVDPGRFCGLHFCHPVTERPLVEVVATAATSPETIDRVIRYATSLGMSPVIVPDGPGFLLNRILVPYMNEALELLLEGTPLSVLDEAALRFGMPLGPVALYDEFGLDVALAVGRSLYRAYPDRIVPSELLIAMYKAGRRGHKTGRGFFATRQDAESGHVSEAAAEIIHERQRDTKRCPDDHVMRRLLLPMLLEATRVLDESIVDSPEVIDLVLKNGLGMTATYRGLFGWADAIGTPTLLEWLQPLSALGARFQPNARLIRMAAGRQRFLMDPACCSHP